MQTFLAYYTPLSSLAEVAYKICGDLSFLEHIGLSLCGTSLFIMAGISKKKKEEKKRKEKNLKQTGT